MNHRICRILVVLTFVSLLPIAALSQNDDYGDVYDNGRTNGTTNAWTINFGFVVSDTFTLTSSTEVIGLNFSAWLFPGDILESAEVSITSSEFGGRTFFDGNVNFTQGNCTSNQLGFNVCDETGSFGSVNLNAGTYWLNLQNAVVNNGDPVYWDENSGPSLASQNSVGTIPSESFTVLGSCFAGANCHQPPPPAPEPGSFLLLGSGIVVTLGAGRRWGR